MAKKEAGWLTGRREDAFTKQDRNDYSVLLIDVEALMAVAYQGVEEMHYDFGTSYFADKKRLVLVKYAVTHDMNVIIKQNGSILHIIKEE